MANLIRVMSKGRKNCPPQETEYQVECTGMSKQGYSGIQVFRILKSFDGLVEAGTKFAIGDEAEQGSYNLIYTGEITKITDKCVTIVRHKGTSMERTYRLSMYEFCWRNFNFNAKRVREHNNVEMQCI